MEASHVARCQLSALPSVLFKDKNCFCLCYPYNALDFTVKPSQISVINLPGKPRLKKEKRTR